MRILQKRFLRWLLIVMAASLVLATGWPQRRAVEWAAGRALGARVEIRDLGLLRTLRASSIRVYDDAGERPMLDARDVAVRYRLWPKDGRRLESVTAESVSVDLEARDARHSNFDFLSRLLNKPKTGKRRDPLTYVPRTFRVAALSGRVDVPGMAVAVNGLRTEGHAPSLDRLEMFLKGDKLEGQWTVPSQGVSGIFHDGRVDVAARAQGLGLRLEPMTVLLPGLVDIDGTARGRIEVGAGGVERVVELDLPRCRVEGVDLSQAHWSFVPFPIEFRSADASGTKLKLVSNARGIFIPQADLHVSAEALGVGEWYRGGLQVTGHARDQKYTIEAVLGAGQKVVAEAQGTPLDATASVRIEGWTREQVLDTLPMLEKWPDLKGLSSNAEVRWKSPAYEVKGVLDPTVGKTKTRVSVDGRGALKGGPLFAGKVKAGFGGGKISADATVESAERLKVEAKVERVDLAALVGLVSDTTVFAKTGTTVSGTVRFGDEVKAAPVQSSSLSLWERVGVRAFAGMGSMGVMGGMSAPSPPPLSPDGGEGESPAHARGLLASAGARGLSPSPPSGERVGVRGRSSVVQASISTPMESSFGMHEVIAALTPPLSQREREKEKKEKVGAVDLVFAPSPLPQVLVADEVSLKGAFSFAEGTVSGKRLDFASGEDARFALRDWSLQTEGAVLKGKFEGEAPATRLTPLAKLDVTGQVKGSAPVTYAKGIVTAPFEATLDEAGYKTYSAAPGVPVSARGKVRYDVKGAKGSVEGLMVDWTDGTKLAVEPLRFTPEPAMAETAYTLKTDLSPLIYLGMLPDVEGTASAKGVFRYSGAFTTEAEVTLEAAQMTLPSQLAVAGGAALKGTFRYAGGISGEGLLGAAKVTSAGATVLELRGPFVLKDGRVVARGLEAGLWDGNVSGDAEVGLFVEGMPTKGSFAVKDMNLETFTREYQPPKSRFSGIGGGTASLEWSRKGFQVFEVDVSATEGFSVNRDLVYQLLMSEYIKDAKVGRSVDKIVERVLGPDEMRAFKSGELKLGLEGEDIAGVARLESESLNLTVDIKMDPNALASLLKLRQEENLEKIDTIKAEPVQLGK